MRVLSWNCQMAFGQKRDRILALKPDILVLCECSQRDAEATPARFVHWIGSNATKGLAVLGFGEHEYRLSQHFSDEFPYFLPIEVLDLNLHLLGVWAHTRTEQLRYVRVTHLAIEHYRHFLTTRSVLLAGDFNSNTLWDSLHPKQSHSLLVEKLGRYS
jgi:endonuclease/exonuclease/phosphatase family metal-dependent hydrolase